MTKTAHTAARNNERPQEPATALAAAMADAGIVSTLDSAPEAEVTSAPAAPEAEVTSAPAGVVRPVLVVSDAAALAQYEARIEQYVAGNKSLTFNVVASFVLALHCGGERRALQKKATDKGISWARMAGRIAEKLAEQHKLAFQFGTEDAAEAEEQVAEAITPAWDAAAGDIVRLDAKLAGRMTSAEKKKAEAKEALDAAAAATASVRAALDVLPEDARAIAEKAIVAAEEARQEAEKTRKRQEGRAKEALAVLDTDASDELMAERVRGALAILAEHGALTMLQSVKKALAEALEKGAERFLEKDAERLRLEAEALAQDNRPDAEKHAEAAAKLGDELTGLRMEAQRVLREALERKALEQQQEPEGERRTG